jgi:tripartite-type tricarboxylate transporter receptor subunit TctC
LGPSSPRLNRLTATLLLGTVSTHSVAPSIYARMPYDPQRDFEPLTLIATIPNLVVANPAKVKATTLREFAQAAKAQPQGFSFGSSGRGSSNHLATEALMAMLRSPAVHVPYKGSNPALMRCADGGRVGLPGVRGYRLVRLLTPAGTPIAVRDRAASELSAIVRSKEMVACLESQGAIPSGISGETFRKYIVDDIAQWKRVAEAAGINPE